MKEYIFIHGKNTELSKHEIQCVFQEYVTFQHTSFSLVKTLRVIGQETLNSLGGTIKIAEVFSEDPLEMIQRESKSKKILFGLSQYGGHEKLSEVLISLKKGLKESGHNARFLNKNFANISSAQIRKSRTMEKGVDLTRCLVSGKWVWAKTIAVQDIDAYGKRDYEKPFRDMTVGMMPPKLAQMMINFAKPERETTIYDPFCGTGTILMEGILRGNPVMGSDLKNRLVDGAKKNLHWVGGQGMLFQHDATQPFSQERFPKDFVIVTEGYLGPPLLHSATPEMQNQIFQNIHSISGPFFKNAAAIMPKGKKLVMCFPYFRSREKNAFYPEGFVKDYEKFGFEIQHHFLYERENQIVGREIIVFQKI